MELNLQGKTAWITGASKGIGRACAERLAQEGCDLVLVSRTQADLERTADELARRHGVQARVFAGDLSKSAIVDRLWAGEATPDVLVNNAGIAQRHGPMLDVDEETFDRIFAVNVKSIYLAAKHGLHLLKAAKGNIVNTSSTAALRPRPGLVWYNGSKGAVNTITKAMALELAPDVRVNAICPVIGATGLTSEFMGGEDTPELREKFIGSVPMGRMSTPLDIANAALYLAGSEGAFITGVCLEVDGGRCV